MRLLSLRSVLAVALSVLVLAPVSSYGQVMYGCDRSAQLFTVNLANGAGAFQCNLPTFVTVGATEIECSPTNPLAWVQGTNGTFSAQEYDFTNCAATSVLIPNFGSFNGLEYVGNVLYAMGIGAGCTDATLGTLNPLAGTFMAIGPSLTGRPISGLAYDTANGIMYGVSGCGAAGPSDLVTVNLVTGLATPVGSTGVNLGSCEFGPSGTLYAGGDTSDGGNIYTINLVTGASTLLGPSGFSQVTGLTLCPITVPTEESTWGATKRLFED